MVDSETTTPKIMGEVAETQDEKDRDEARLVKRREQELDFSERTLKLRLAISIVIIAFLYLIFQSIAKAFGFVAELPPWQYWTPFVAAALGVVFGFDFRDYIGRK
jgi:sterol desaturase/sphingolipid hydroxylase (fatty acid hydroxylase superfamily)